MANITKIVFSRRLTLHLQCFREAMTGWCLNACHHMARGLHCFSRGHCRETPAHIFDAKRKNAPASRTHWIMTCFLNEFASTALAWNMAFDLMRSHLTAAPKTSGKTVSNQHTTPRRCERKKHTAFKDISNYYLVFRWNRMRGVGVKYAIRSHAFACDCSAQKP